MMKLSRDYLCFSNDKSSHACWSQNQIPRMKVAQPEVQTPTLFLTVMMMSPKTSNPRKTLKHLMTCVSYYSLLTVYIMSFLLHCAVCQWTDRRDQQKSVPSIFCLQVPLLIPAKQLFAISVTLILLVSHIHAQKRGLICSHMEQWAHLQMIVQASQMQMSESWQETGL